MANTLTSSDTTTLLEAALMYASVGWSVFPCKARTKIPATAHGVHDATKSESVIRQWWGRGTPFNIGVACGDISNIVVLDADVDKEKGADGVASLGLLEHGALPDTLYQRTPRGGLHLFYLLPQSASAPKSATKFLQHVELKSNGTYVIIAPSVHPNGGTYKWGCEFSFERIAKAPQLILQRAEEQQTATRGLTHGEITLPSDIQERAIAYLETVDPAVEGSGGHGQLLWAASALVHGFMLDESTAFRLLADHYNPRCEPPWNLSKQRDYLEFMRKVSEAARLEPRNPRGWLLDGPREEDARTVCDVTSLLRSIEGEAKAEPSRLIWNTWEEEIYEQVLSTLIRPVGLVGDICAWINETSLKPQPFLTLGCVLAFCGALFGRKVKDRLGGRTNIYCMGVAQTSAGKAHAPTQIRTLCSEAGCLEVVGGDDLASDSALEKRMEKCPSTLFLFDEIGHFFSEIKHGSNQYLARVVPLLMKLYSLSKVTYLGREYAEDDKQRKIVQPCCCLYGTSTPERLVEGMSFEEIADGWLSRCLVFRSESNPEKNRFADMGKPPDSSIVERVAKWAKRRVELEGKEESLGKYIDYMSGSPESIRPEQILVETGSGAERLFKELDECLQECGERHKSYYGLLAKGEENARRIALIIAAGDSYDSPEITEGIAEYSCKLVKFLLQDFIYKAADVISPKGFATKRTRLLNIISSESEISKTSLCRKTKWLRKRERDDLLIELAEEGSITITRHARGVYLKVC